MEAVSELVEKCGLTCEDIDKPVSDAHLERISSTSCEDWRKLPAHLELEKTVKKDIDRSKEDEETKRQNFFLAWQKRKGSQATYEKLLSALMIINCADDAETVCKLLKDSLPTHAAIKDTPDAATAMSTTTTATTRLDADTHADLEIQLEKNIRHISEKYTSYVSCIRESMEAKGVNLKDVRSDLMTFNAFSHTEKKIMPISAHRAKLERATDLNAIFDLIAEKYASFLDIEVFQFLLNKYHLDEGQEEFKYRDHMKAYINKHKISEFMEINPLLRNITDDSEQLLLKVDIEITERLAKITNLKAEIAKILGLKTASLQLIDITEGCVVVIFLIPTPVAKDIFNTKTSFDKKQQKAFRALSVSSLHCNDYTIAFTGESPDFTQFKHKKIPRSPVNITAPESKPPRPKRMSVTFINPPDELKCVICLEVAINQPHQHAQCGKIVCKDCLEQHGEEKPCPSCRTKGNFYTDQKSKREIQALKVLCSNADEKGCEWEGKFEDLGEHINSGLCKKSSLSKNCYVFVHDSSLWIQGQKFEGKKLVDTHIDKRYRVDLGKFLRLVSKGRNISKAFLYGSEPPPNDSLWKAIEKQGYYVDTSKRSKKGKEKEVQGAMSRDVMENLYELEDKKKAIFIIVTGDRNFKPLIEATLKKEVSVELWFWKDSISKSYNDMASTHDIFTIYHLDDFRDKFSFTAYMTPYKKKVDPGHSIVYAEFPEEEEIYLLADHLRRLYREFYITPVKSQTKGLIVEFPHSDIDVVLRQLSTLEFEYKPITYIQYKQKQKQGFNLSSEILLTNRFTALEDTNDE